MRVYIGVPLFWETTIWAISRTIGFGISGFMPRAFKASKCSSFWGCTGRWALKW